MSDFDYWPKPALQHIVKVLRPFGEDLPSVEDDLWSQLLEECKKRDTSGEVTVDAHDLAKDVTTEFKQVKMQNSGLDDIFVGDLACAESRLVSAVRGIRGVVYIASHPMEALWARDGINYHTILVSPAIEPSKTLRSQLLSACKFIATHRPALICCSCPTFPALVLASYIHHESFGRVPIHVSLASAEHALSLSPGQVSESDICELEAFASDLVPPTASPREEEGDEGDDDDQMELATPRCGKPMLRSSDSNVTQVDAELISSEMKLPLETPRKHVARQSAGSDEESAGIITRRGQWKRQSYGEILMEASSPSSKKTCPILSTVDDRATLSRGTCTTCSQTDVLGWARRTEVLVGLGTDIFECCACHDANDDDE